MPLNDEPAAVGQAPLFTLADLGWDEGWRASLAATAQPGLRPGRISRIDLGLCTVLGAAGSQRATTDRKQDLAVGDWVTLEPAAAASERPRVAVVLPRRSAVRRGAEGGRTQEQVVAANIDTIFVVLTLEAAVNARRLERLLALSWQSGATPVVLLTKADLVDPAVVANRSADVGDVALGVSVHALSANSGDGLDELTPYLQRGRTVALLGMSGAGKSTLVNRLARSEVLATGELRADGKGRHTTTHRQLVPLAGGGLLIDTPGIRAVSLWDATEGVERTFADIEDLGRRCRFRDCSHRAEPGCAVTAALRAGELAAARLQSWQQLHQELDDLAARQADQGRAEDRNTRRQAAKGDRPRSGA